MNRLPHAALKGASALSIIVGVAAYVASASLPGKPNPLVVALIASAVSFVYLRPTEFGVGAAETHAPGRRSKASNRSTVKPRRPSTPDARKPMARDDFRAEQDFNTMLYHEIQADLRMLDIYGTDWAEYRFYFDKVRSNERRLAQSNARLRSMPR